MSPTRLLSELETVAARLGIAVRVEPFGDEQIGARGGLCRVRGRPLILIDASLPVADQISVLAGALSAFDVSSIYVPPLVRARIELTAGPRARAASARAGSSSPYPSLSRG